MEEYDYTTVVWKSMITPCMKSVFTSRLCGRHKYVFIMTLWKNMFASHLHRNSCFIIDYVCSYIVRLVNEASDGRYLYDNVSVPCGPAPIHQSHVNSMPKKTLQVCVHVHCKQTVAVTLAKYNDVCIIVSDPR